MARVIVVGAGIVGLSCAYFLAGDGHEVVVLDRAQPSAGASGGNAGLIAVGHPPLTVPGASVRGLRWMLNRNSPLYVRPRLDPDLWAWLWTFHLHCDADWTARCMDLLAPMGQASIALLREMLDEIDGDPDWRDGGWLDVVMDPGNLDLASDEAEGLTRYGLQHERLDGDCLREREPGFADQVAGAIWYRDSASVDPARLMDGLLAACERRGVDVHIGCTAIRVSHNPARVGLADGDVVEAEQVVIAAGVWSEELCRTAGLRVPMQPARGYHVELEDMPLAPRTACVLHETFVAVTPMHRRVRLAGTLEIAPTGRPWTRRRLAGLRRAAAPYLRHPGEGRIVGEWAGYRPCTADGLPVVGRVPGQPSLIVATGHAMMGLTLGPITGKLVSEIVGERTPTFDASLLDPGRF